MSEALRKVYEERRTLVLNELALTIKNLLAEYLKDMPRVDRIQARAKAVDRFLAKAAKEEAAKPKYPDPVNQIQDQIGARVVGFYLSDVNDIGDAIERYFRPIEQRFLIPESEAEFGYFGKHYVLLIPEDVKDPNWDPKMVPDFFELQVKTLFQHAWSEANHDLGYKPGGRDLSSDEKRLMAFASAQAWGADKVFNDLFNTIQRT